MIRRGVWTFDQQNVDGRGCLESTPHVDWWIVNVVVFLLTWLIFDVLGVISVECWVVETFPDPYMSLVSKTNILMLQAIISSFKIIVAWFLFISLLWTKMDSNLGHEDAIVWVKVPGQSSDIRDPRQHSPACLLQYFSWLIFERSAYVGFKTQIISRSFEKKNCSLISIPSRTVSNLD